MTMNKVAIGLLIGVLFAAGCSLTTQPFQQSPGKYGLFVASTWLYANNPVTVQDAASGKTYAIQIKRIGTEKTTYLVQSLPPGHYYVYSLASYSGGSAPLKTGNSYFEVQADCFNYAGQVDLQSLDEEQPDLYSDDVAAGLAHLPPDIKALAEGRDICISALGHASQRIPAARAQELFGSGS